jgi:DNA-binding winged helix-turn-helix (wHTH) protein/TolB-like protein/Tfp pilus assembly protein PilF
MSSKIYEFGEFLLSPRERRLTKQTGEAIALTPRVFDLLVFLVESGGETVSRNELLDKIWGKDTFVEEGNLTQSISVLRKALGETKDNHPFILTVPQHGYRFIAAVREISKPEDEIKPTAETTASLTAENSSDSASVAETDNRSLLNRQSYFKGEQFRHFAVSLAVIVLVVLLTSFWVWREPAPRSPAEVKSIAVLPFQDLGAEKAENIRGFGIADALTNKLSNFSRLSVRPTGSVQKYSNGKTDVTEIGRELDVETVLQGSIQRAADRFYVSVQLVRVSDRTIIWADAFEGRDDNILRFQSAISDGVINALELPKTEAESHRVAKDYTLNDAAYQLYWRGRFFLLKRTKKELFLAIDYYRRALEQDENYALAYAGIADCYLMLGDYTYSSPKESFPHARENALRALTIDPDLAEAHTALAYVKYLYDWDWAGAEDSFKKAIQLNPNYSTAHQWYAEFLVTRHRFDEAESEIAAARRIEPNGIALNAVSGWIPYLKRDYDAAVRKHQQTVELDANFFLTHLFLALSLDAVGRRAEALEEYKLAVERDGSTEAVAYLGRAYGLAGRRAEALEILEKLKAMSAENYVSPFFFALVYDGLGEREQTLQWLQKAVDEHARVVPIWAIEPHLDNLRAEPRFMDLLRRANL